MVAAVKPDLLDNLKAGNKNRLDFSINDEEVNYSQISLKSYTPSPVLKAPIYLAPYQD